jgi:hypothetical protein
MAVKLQILVAAVGVGILALVVWFAAASYAAETDPSAPRNCVSGSDSHCVQVRPDGSKWFVVDNGQSFPLTPIPAK